MPRRIFMRLDSSQPDSRRLFFLFGSWGLVLLAVLCLGIACDSSSEPENNKFVAGSGMENQSTKPSVVGNLILNEDTMLDLSPRLVRIARWFEQVSIGESEISQPDLITLENVAPLQDVSLETLLGSASRKADLVDVADWPIATTVGTYVNPWGPLLSKGIKWETIKFGVLSARFEDAAKTNFRMEVKSEGRGTAASGQAYGFKGKQLLTWKREESGFSLVGWEEQEMHLKRAESPLFKECLADVVNDAKQLETAQRSFKDEIILRAALSGRIELPIAELDKWINVASNHIFPSVSVVDIDSDGLDDLFISARWGPTQMFRNLGNGAFVDVAEEIGLQEPYMVNCAVFVDIDNDGDKDAFLGRPMATTKFLINDAGKFVDATESHTNLGDQYFISAFSVSDVNRDGLLDVYLSSYPALNMTGNAPFEETFLTPEERAIYLEKNRESSNRRLDLAGSANVLLMNRGGGKLERVPYDDLLAQWRRSFQSVWADFDGDGDDDLYVCNDFAPDALLRNETPQGAANPIFTDVTDLLLADVPLGFGMGASWGDFDRDGDLDVYVSNMYSKAGKRIIGHFENKVDPRIAAAAAGNFLYENQEGGFRQRAGTEEGDFHINQVGWSYGGQWADFDNDGQLDLYVPSGYFTAPKEIDTQVDT